MCHRWFYCNSRNANFYLGPSVLKEVVVFVLNCRGAYNSFTVCACVRFGRLGSPTSEKVFALALLIYFADIWLSVGRKGAATVKTAGTPPLPGFGLPTTPP